MARLQRVTSKVFAENATEVGQFGSLNAGTKVTTTDIAEIQALPAWQNGWQAATVGKNCYPTLQERNGLDKVQSYFLNYLLQEGIPEWDSGTTYYTGSIVKLINGTNVQLYQSLVDNNTSALSDTTSWLAYDYADVDLTNVNQTGKNNIMAWGMPDLTATPLPVYDNTNFTASYDGFLQGGVATGLAAGHTYIDFIDSNGTLIKTFMYGYSTNDVNQYAVTIPVSKGTTIKIRPTWSSYVWLNGAQVNGRLSFYPLKGAN